MSMAYFEQLQLINSTGQLLVCNLATSVERIFMNENLIHQVSGGYEWNSFPLMTSHTEIDNNLLTTSL